MHHHRPLLVFIALTTACAPDSDAPIDTAPTNTVCTEEAVRETNNSCGPENEGVYVEVCENDAWTDKGVCLLHPSGTENPPGRINVFSGYAPAEWDYGEPRNNQVRGWSYYLRAFDLMREQPVQEVGWGQWTKPEAPSDGLEVCGIHTRLHLRTL